MSLIYLGVDHPDKIIMTYWSLVNYNNNVDNFFKHLYENNDLFFEHMIYDRKNTTQSKSITYLKDDNYNFEEMLNHYDKWVLNLYHRRDSNNLYILKNKKWHECSPPDYLFIPLNGTFTDISTSDQW